MSMFDIIANKTVKSAYFPEYQITEEIPRAWYSSVGDPSYIRYLNPSVLHAVGKVLAGKIEYQVDPSGLVLQYQTDGSHSRTVLYANEESWQGVSEAGGMWLIPLMLSLTSPKFPQIRTAWAKLLATLGAKGPLGIPVIQQTSTQPLVKQALFHLADCIYQVAMKESQEVELEQKCDLAVLTTTESIEPLFQFIAPMVDQVSLALERLQLRGGAALLSGPPGTFKTERVKQLAVNTNSQLFIIEGRPGMEDRDFYGRLQPDGLDSEGRQIFAYIDGPLTQAIDAAAKGEKTILFLDELLRFESVYLNAIIGFLNTYSRAQVLAQGIKLESSAERFYMLKIPNGTIVAPQSNLLIVAATNMGDGFVQSAALDDALISRFDITLEIDRVPFSVLEPIYLEVARGNPRLASAAYQLEQATYGQTAEEGKLLRLEANPRQSINLIKETLALEQQGQPLREAFVLAVDLTLMGYCCPREMNGKLSTDAKRFLLELARGIAKHAWPTLVPVKNKKKTT